MVSRAIVDAKLTPLMHKFLLLIILLLPALQGCSPAPDARHAAIAPGTMRMISVEPVDDSTSTSLLRNGSFEEWYGGLPAPTGFRAPEASAESTLQRDAKTGQLGTTGYVARETWTGPGFGAAPEATFGTTVTLKPATQYRLEVIASATAGMAATIGAVERDGSGLSRVIARAVVEVRGEAPTRYSGTFTTVSGGVVVLSSHAVADSTLPGSVNWLSWKLAEAQETITPVNVADAPERRLLVNQALDQIRGQVALYGGVDAWSESTAPNRKNAARILREEGAKGETILGYEQHVSSKAELAWFEASSAPSPVGEKVDGPAAEALLRHERTLNARGIQLIVVAVPERVQLYFDQIYRPSTELPLNLSAHAALIEPLLSDDVLMLDMAPALWTMKASGKRVFWHGDLDVPSATLHALADQVAPVLTSLGLTPPAKRGEYAVKVDTIKLEQRLVPGLPEAFRNSVEQEVHAVQHVRDGAGELFQPAEAGPVIAAGNLAVLHQVRGASFAARLSMDLGFPVVLPSKNLPDTEVLAYLTGEEVPEMARAKFVVFCVSDLALSQGGWK